MNTERLEQLKGLRGQHDQTMRTQAIEIVYGWPDNHDGLTTTERFLEVEIARAEHEIRLAKLGQAA